MPPPAADELDLRRQLRLLQLYGAFTFPFACIPFLYFYFLDYGVDLASYGTLIAVYYVSMVVLEIPTGMFADRYGNKIAMVLGPIVLAAGFTIIWAFESFAAFCVGEVIFGLGHSILSGPPSALLFQTLKAKGRTTEYQRHEGRIQATRLFGTGTSFLIGGVTVWALGIPASIVLTALLCLVATAAACFVAEPHARAFAIAPSQSLLRVAVRDLRKSQVLWVLGYYVLLFWLLRFPFHTYQPFLKDAGADAPLTIGILFFALNLFAAPFSRMTASLTVRFGERAMFWAMPSVLALSLIVMAGQVNAFGIGLFFLHQIPFGMHWAIVQNFVQHRIEDTARATVLSVMSFAGRLAFAIGFPLVVWSGSVTTSYIMVGVGGAALIIPVMLLGNRYLAPRQ